MSTTDQRIPLAEAQRYATAVQDLLRPACVRIEVAGSIRRRRSTIGDLELVAIPQVVHHESSGTTLFGGDPYDENRVVSRVKDLWLDAVLWPRSGRSMALSNPDVLKDPRYLKLAYGIGKGKSINVDLFLTTPEQWGYIFMLRTGSADYMHHVVTPLKFGGLCPPNVRFQGGWMQALVPSEDETADGTWANLPTEQEDEVFWHLGTPFLAPPQREYHP